MNNIILSENKKNLYFESEQDFQRYIIYQSFKVVIPMKHIITLKEIFSNLPYDYSEVNQIDLDLSGDDDYLEFHFSEPLGKMVQKDSGNCSKSCEIRIMRMIEGDYSNIMMFYGDLNELIENIVNTASLVIYEFSFKPIKSIDKVNIKQYTRTQVYNFINELFSDFRKWFYFNPDDLYFKAEINEFYIPIYFKLQDVENKLIVKRYSNSYLRDDYKI